MRTFKFLSIFASIVFAVTSCSTNRIDNIEITSVELEEHINFLASEELAGRLPGTEGDRLAALYIRDNLASWGLKPMVDNGQQKFNIVASIKPGEDNSLIINDKEYSSGSDFIPFSFSEDGTATGEVLFAGYGLSISEEDLTWNDYEETDAEGKWVLILRADPEVDNSMSHFANYSGDRDKAMVAKDNGALGVLFVSGVEFDPKDEFESLSKEDYSVGIPVLRITRPVANEILKPANKNIETLEEMLNITRQPASFSLAVMVSAKSDLEQEYVKTQNIIMTLPGNDPQLKDEYIIIGGHFDHLGMGGKGTSSRAPDTIAVHYGADDNASGIASMLEIAEKAAGESNNARTIIFAAFAAEEIGLLGSKYMAENLGVDPANVNAMINLDMVGRMKENNLLQIGGVGTSKTIPGIITELADTGLFTLSLSEEGFGPSDHSSFYGKDIPVLFFSTGAHLDYHTPYDTPDKINYEGLVSISNLVYDISCRLSNDSSRLQFSEAGPKVQASRGMRKKGVTLGIMPDFAGSVKNGLRADFITPGKPANLGGMQKGDIIVAINGLSVNNIQDYMFRLSKLNYGETITVEIIRGDKKEVLLIAL
ncbi:MAG: M20/M25/M40 family metallo-hydrolase [Bacteroidales bacterium]|nr:M20/M25/M40 family metallo-hydrolase [Bacteroidales bacterium]